MFIVSQHAIVRWLERAQNVDMKNIKSEYIKKYDKSPTDREILTFIELDLRVDISGVKNFLKKIAIETYSKYGRFVSNKSFNIKRDGLVFVFSENTLITIMER